MPHDQLPASGSGHLGPAQEPNDQGGLSKCAPAAPLVDGDGDAASELLRLRAEVQRLEADSQAEQTVIDNLLHTLTTAQDDLASAQACLADKEAECVSLRDRLGQPLPATELTAAVDSDSIVVTGLRQQIDDLVQQLAEKDAALRTAEADAVQQQLKTQDGGYSLGQAKDQNNGDARDLQELLQYFKSNSEAVAKENRVLQTQVQQLSEDLDVSNKSLENERSANIALKMQAGVVS